MWIQSFKIGYTKGVHHAQGQPLCWKGHDPAVNGVTPRMCTWSGSQALDLPVTHCPSSRAGDTCNANDAKMPAVRHIRLVIACVMKNNLQNPLQHHSRCFHWVECQSLSAESFVRDSPVFTQGAFDSISVLWHSVGVPNFKVASRHLVLDATSTPAPLQQQAALSTPPASDARQVVCRPALHHPTPSLDGNVRATPGTLDAGMRQPGAAVRSPSPTPWAGNCNHRLVPAQRAPCTTVFRSLLICSSL